MATQNLELSISQPGPYCQGYVFMEQNNIELPMHDIVADDFALASAHCWRQAPGPVCSADGKAMYETAVTLTTFRGSCVSGSS